MGSPQRPGGLRWWSQAVKSRKLCSFSNGYVRFPCGETVHLNFKAHLYVMKGSGEIISSTLTFI